MSSNLGDIKFYLGFATSNEPNPLTQRIRIAEPIGFDVAEFTLQQEQGRYGRDVFFTDAELEFSPNVNVRRKEDGDWITLTHQFDKLIQLYRSKGFESYVQFVLEIDGTIYVIGQLDFLTAETNLYDYFRCNVIQENLQSQIKQRADVKVDLYSDKDYNELPITPITPESVLLKALPIQQESEWRIPQTIGGQMLISTSYGISPTAVIINSDIEDTLSPQFSLHLESDTEDLKNFVLLEAANNLTNISLIFENFDYDAGSSNSNLTYLKISYGDDFDTRTEMDEILIDTANSDFNTTIELPTIFRGQRLWFWFKIINTGTTTYFFNSGTIRIESTSTSVASITDGVRIIDAMRQVVLLNTGANVVAPRFDEGGEFYDNFIFKGNQIRKIDDKPFTVSFSDILSWLPECNLDYEVTPDGDVFFGIEDDFHTNVEIDAFEDDVLKGYSSKMNTDFAVNKITYKYNTFESGGNEEQKNSLEGVSTHLEMKIPNRMVENTLNIDVGFIRDAFVIEKTRKKNIVVSENSASEEDEDIFIVDVIEGNTDRLEKLILRHILKPDGESIDLINDGSFNWELTGVYIGGFFTILEGSENTGIYEVTAIEPTVITIIRLSPPYPTFSGIVLTEIEWYPQTTLVNRTDEGFVDEQNLSNYYANLKYAPKRNLMKYWGRHLRTCIEYGNSKTFINTLYVNGGDVFLNFEDEGIFNYGFQNRNFLISNLQSPILSNELITVDVICTFDRFWNVQNGSRTDRGYITIKNTLGNNEFIYIKEAMYSINEMKMTIVGKKKKLNLNE